MAYINDIIKAAGEAMPSYRITVIGKRGIILEGFRRILAFDDSRAVLTTGKLTVTVRGRDMRIKDMTEGYVWLAGEVFGVVREEEEKQ